MNPRNKVALITGGAHGIGKATAQRLAQAGATVIIADVDVPAGEALAAELGGAHRFHKLDVTSQEEWEALVARIGDELGGLHILFLNAGILSRPHGAPALDPAMNWFSFENYRRVARINADGVAYGVLAAFPLMRQSGGGIIMATASTAAVDFYPGDPTYSMTKAGILAMVKALASEFDAQGVRICAIGPGSIDTRIYPSDRRGQRSGSSQSGPADPLYLANCVLTVIDRGRSGDIWYARPDDGGFFTFEPKRLPPSPATADEAQGRRFVAATPDGATIEGLPADQWIAHRD